MFRKTLTAALAALTLSAATLAPTAPAQAGGLGKLIVAGVVGAVVGAVASRPAQAEQPSYGYRPVRAYEGGYGGCGFRNSPIFDEDGHRIGARRVPAC